MFRRGEVEWLAVLPAGIAIIGRSNSLVRDADTPPVIAGPSPAEKLRPKGRI